MEEPSRALTRDGEPEETIPRQRPEELNGSSITLDGTTFKKATRSLEPLRRLRRVNQLDAHHIALNGGSFEGNGEGFLGGGGGIFVGAIANRDGSSITMDGTTFGSIGTGSPGGDITLQARRIALKGSILEAGNAEFAGRQHRYR